MVWKEGKKRAKEVMHSYLSTDNDFDKFFFGLSLENMRFTNMKLSHNEIYSNIISILGDKNSTGCFSDS